MKATSLAAALLAAFVFGTANAADEATITGRITSAGKPVPFAVVIADYDGVNVAARADADGHYKITGAPTGHHDVFSFGEGGYIYDHGGFPDLTAGNNDHSRNLVHLRATPLAPTVDHVKWAATSGVPGATLAVARPGRLTTASGYPTKFLRTCRSSCIPRALASGKRTAARIRTETTRPTFISRPIRSRVPTPRTSSVHPRRAIRP